MERQLPGGPGHHPPLPPGQPLQPGQAVEAIEGESGGQGLQAQGGQEASHAGLLLLPRPPPGLLPSPGRHGDVPLSVRPEKSAAKISLNLNSMLNFRLISKHWKT